MPNEYWKSNRCHSIFLKKAETSAKVQQSGPIMVTMAMTRVWNGAGTVFVGSLYSTMVLAGWMYVIVSSKDHHTPKAL
jgi:acyl-CoA hydrolase